MLTPPELLEGALPRAQLRFVLAWAELNQAEIEENWKRVKQVCRRDAFQVFSELPKRDKRCTINYIE